MKAVRRIDSTTWASRSATIVLTTVTAISACTESGTTSNQDRSWDQFLASSTRQVEIDGSERIIYLVEGDMEVSLEELRSYYNSYIRPADSELEQTQQASTVDFLNGSEGIWTDGREQNLTYCVSTEFGGLKDRVAAEMIQATSAWEHAADVRFTYLSANDANCNSSNSGVFFYVRPLSINGGCAFRPRFQTSCGGLIRTLEMDYPAIDSGEAFPDNPNLATIGVLRHELGHILGLRHEQVRAPGNPCPEQDPSEGITSYDQRSVMHYPWCAGNTDSDETLTILDRQGVRKLYNNSNVIRDHRFTRIDVDLDFREDVLLVGLPAYTGLPIIPMALSNSSGGFDVTFYANSDFASWATAGGVDVLPGDYDGDGATDIALTGNSSWYTVPVAFSDHDGTFTVTNQTITNFAAWAATDNARAITGDFNGDGRTDIALTGGAGWYTMPIAFSNGDGSFTVTNQPITSFAGWATAANVKIIVGDFNGDGCHDLALTGAATWYTLPVAMSNCNGAFTVTNSTATNFAGWASAAGADVVAGDFDADGRTDIALVGVSGWTTIPVARSNGDGSFAVSNTTVATFPSMADDLLPQPVVGFFNNDLRTDIALIGGGGWTTIPVAFSSGAVGTFSVTNLAVSNFPTWASTGAQPIAGDFDADGRTDIALGGSPNWSTIPRARSLGDGQFSVSNPSVGSFAGWAALGGVWIFD